MEKIRMSKEESHCIKEKGYIDEAMGGTAVYKLSGEKTEEIGGTCYRRFVRDELSGVTEGYVCADFLEEGAETVLVQKTTLCYMEQDGKYLMLHRVKKENDLNEGKWIGIGGKFEDGETAEECLLREVKEETGLTLTSWQLRGIITFHSDSYEVEDMYLFTADGFTGNLVQDCPEGELRWVPIDRLGELELWEGDKLFLEPLRKGEQDIRMTLAYEGKMLKGYLFIIK